MPTILASIKSARCAPLAGGSAASYADINVATLYSIAVQESGMRWCDGTFGLGRGR